MKLFILFTLLFSSLYAVTIKTGAQSTGKYLPLLKDKKVAVVVNQSSLVDNTHLVDLLLEHKIQLKTIFAPEHGFRGMADAGEHLKNGIDIQSGLPIISLYGKHKKPTKKDLEGIDVIVFDIQDVGVRFYTYLSTLHYIMEAAAESDVKVIVLDRPNPNGNRIDGPVMQKKFYSFVGLHPVPLLYGMTIGEYAEMINGEGWLNNGVKTDLHVVELEHYTHNTFYHLPIKPSPNLPNDLSVLLYPSLALFEGTQVSAGRGTEKQFQLYGTPHYQVRKFSFIPKPMSGAKYPKHKGKRCYGVDLSRLDVKKLHQIQTMDLTYLLDAYKNYDDKEKFFLKNDFFDRLAGNNSLQQQVISVVSEENIRKSWERELVLFRAIRQKYLLYP